MMHYIILFTIQSHKFANNLVSHIHAPNEFVSGPHRPMAVCGTCLELTSESGSEVLRIFHHQFWQCYCKVCLVHVCMSQSLQWYSWAGSLSIFNKVSAKAKAAPILKMSSKQKRCAKAMQLGFWRARKMLTRLAETTQACFKHFKSKCDYASWLRPCHFFPSAQAPIPAQTEGPVANGGPSRKVWGIVERLSCKQTDKNWRVPHNLVLLQWSVYLRLMCPMIPKNRRIPILINDIDLRNWSEAHRGAFQANVGFLQANEPQSFFSGSAAPICCRMNLSWRTKHNCTNFFRMMSGQPSYGMPWIC